MIAVGKAGAIPRGSPSTLEPYCDCCGKRVTANILIGQMRLRGGQERAKSTEKTQGGVR